MGPYDQLPAAYDALSVGAKEQGRELVGGGLMWEEYWSGPETPAAEIRTEVFWPLVA